VRSGYNKIASTYAASRTDDSEDIQLLSLLVERLPRRALVLDAGCGSGYPVAQILAKSFQVVGVDFAPRQIQLAIGKVPDALFVCADLSNLPFKNGAFDAVCSYYAIIHVPRSEHSKLLRDFHRVLRVGGLALLCMGAGDLPEDIGDWCRTEMFWSHYDGKTNLTMMKENGFDILWSKVVKDPIDPTASHLFVLGQKTGP
jgi:SAM-dependent methyltransferase